MEKRVKLFIDDDHEQLEDRINYFLGQTIGKLHDIKYAYQEGISDPLYSAMLIYTEE